MPQDKNRQFIDFEKPIKELIEEIADLQQKAAKGKVDYAQVIEDLQAQVLQKRKELTGQLTSWQRVQLSRHPDRPYTLKYIQKMTDNFVELHGDRNVKDDKAMVGGFATLPDGNDHWAAKRDQYKNQATSQLWNGQSRGIQESIASYAAGREIQ